MTGAWRVRLGREPNRFSPFLSRVNQVTLINYPASDDLRFSHLVELEHSLVPVQVRPFIFFCFKSAVSNRPGTPVRRRRRTVSDSSLNTDRFLTQVEQDALGPVKERALL